VPVTTYGPFGLASIVTSAMNNSPLPTNLGNAARAVTLSVAVRIIPIHLPDKARDPNNSI
jgi:hypothetical protein